MSLSIRRRQSHLNSQQIGFRDRDGPPAQGRDADGPGRDSHLYRKDTPISPVSIILNILWLATGGIAVAFGWLIAAVIMAITIIGFPWSFAAFRIAWYTLLPFGQEMRPAPASGVLSTLGNIVWFVLAGWWL